MNLLLIQIESGVALAAIYSLLAVSLTFTYRVTGVVQLAQGAILMCGAFAGYFVGVATQNLIFVALAAAATSAALGFLVYEGAFRWLLSGGHLPPLVAGLAIALILEEILRLSFFNGQPTPFPEFTWTRSLGTTGINALVVGSALAVGVAFELLLRRTQVGRSLRATADDVESARLLGIPAERMRLLSFVLGAGLAGIAGVLISIVYGSIAFGYGAFLEFVAVACILLGGLGSVPGALVGALVIGLGQVLVSTYVSASYVNALVFGIVLLVIFFRPGGIFGQSQAERA